jgi:hypothetical protein
MAPATRRIVLTFDNFSDYFPSDYAESLVRGLTARGLDPGDPLVTEFRAWVDARADRPPGTEFVLDPAEAALLLEHVAGWRED